MGADESCMRVRACALALRSLPYDVIAATALTDALSSRAWYLQWATLRMYCDNAEGESVFSNKMCDYASG